MGPEVSESVITAEKVLFNRSMTVKVDDREIQLKRQNHVYFQISGAGHEASGAAAAMHLKAGHDWFFPYYRDRALCLGDVMGPSDVIIPGSTLQAIYAAEPTLFEDFAAAGDAPEPVEWIWVVPITASEAR